MKDVAKNCSLFLILASLLLLGSSRTATAADVEATRRANFHAIDSIEDIFVLLNKLDIKAKNCHFVIDFDETIAQSILTYFGTEFKLIGNMERLRVHRNMTRRVYEKLEIKDDQYFEFKIKQDVKYRPLEERTTQDVLVKLHKKKAKISVCSGNEISVARQEVINSFNKAISPHKSPIEYHCVPENKVALFQKIPIEKDVIIFIDNNKKCGPSSVRKFVEHSSQLQAKKVIGIYLKYFDTLHTEDALEKEYKKFLELEKELLNACKGEYESVLEED